MPNGGAFLMHEPSSEETLSTHCQRCQKVLYRGLARCRACGALRPEFESRATVVSEHIGACCRSGAKTDVRLPSGHYLWAPYFLDMLAEGWLDAKYELTAKCRWLF